MTPVLPLALAYVALVAFVIAILASAKRGDEAMEESKPAIRVFAGPAHPGRGPVTAEAPVDALPGHEELGDLAAHLGHMLGAERVSVVVGDDVDSGLVAA